MYLVQDGDRSVMIHRPTAPVISQGYCWCTWFNFISFNSHCFTVQLQLFLVHIRACILPLVCNILLSLTVQSFVRLFAAMLAVVAVAWILYTIASRESDATVWLSRTELESPSLTVFKSTFRLTFLTWLILMCNVLPPPLKLQTWQYKNVYYYYFIFYFFVPTIFIIINLAYFSINTIRSSSIFTAINYN